MEFEFYERSSVSVRITKKENFSMKPIFDRYCEKEIKDVCLRSMNNDFKKKNGI